MHPWREGIWVCKTAKGTRYLGERWGTQGHLEECWIVIVTEATKIKHMEVQKKEGND